LRDEIEKQINKKRKKEIAIKGIRTKFNLKIK
jgi:hypothetical protein